jgi:hypothetical protein
MATTSGRWSLANSRCDEVPRDFPPGIINIQDEIEVEIYDFGSRPVCPYVMAFHGTGLTDPRIVCEYGSVKPSKGGKFGSWVYASHVPFTSYGFTKDGFISFFVVSMPCKRSAEVDWMFGHSAWGIRLPVSLETDLVFLKTYGYYLGRQEAVVQGLIRYRVPLPEPSPRWLDLDSYATVSPFLFGWDELAARRFATVSPPRAIAAAPQPLFQRIVCCVRRGRVRVASLSGAGSVRVASGSGPGSVQLQSWRRAGGVRGCPAGVPDGFGCLSGGRACALPCGGRVRW